MKPDAEPPPAHAPAVEALQPGRVRIYKVRGVTAGIHPLVGLTRIGTVHDVDVADAARLTAGEQPEFEPLQAEDAAAVHAHRAAQAPPAADVPAAAGVTDSGADAHRLSQNGPAQVALEPVTIVMPVTAQADAGAATEVVAAPADEPAAIDLVG